MYFWISGDGKIGMDENTITDKDPSLLESEIFDHCRRLCCGLLWVKEWNCCKLMHNKCVRFSLTFVRINHDLASTVASYETLTNVWMITYCYLLDMMAYFCSSLRYGGKSDHLSDLYVDLSDFYVDLSDLYVDLSDLCVDLSDLYFDLSDLYVDFSDLYVDLLDLYVEFSLIHLLENKSWKRFLSK